MAKNKFKTEDLLNMDIESMRKMNQKDLSKAVSQLGAIANKRAKRLSESELGTSSALLQYERSGGKITTKGKSWGQLRKEFRRVQKFLTAKTSTIKGAKKFQSEMVERIGGQANEFSQDDWKIFWKTYNDIVDGQDTKIALYRLGSDRLQEMIRDEMTSGNNVEDIIKNAADLAYQYETERDNIVGEIDEKVFDLWEW